MDAINPTFELIQKTMKDNLIHDCLVLLKNVMTTKVDLYTPVAKLKAKYQWDNNMLFVLYISVFTTIGCSPKMVCRYCFPSFSFSNTIFKICLSLVMILKSIKEPNSVLFTTNN